jgi:hypothetical protein
LNKGRHRVRYNLGCSLSYEIGSEVTFIFNLEVARIAGQELLKESLILSPPLERSVYTDPATRNRYFGVNVAPDMLALEYNAEVELVVHRANPGNVNETPISQMPLATFWRKIDVFGSTVNGLRPSKDRRAAGGHF